MAHTKSTLENRFWERVDKTDTCWNWTGALNKRNEYGVFSWESQRVLVHRFSYELHNDEIPVGMLVLHACDNRKCVRPDHLFLGTHLENHRDKARKGRCDNTGVRGIRTRDMSDDERHEALRMFVEEGKTQAQIGEALGIRQSTVSNTIVRFGIVVPGMFRGMTALDRVDLIRAFNEERLAA